MSATIMIVIMCLVSFALLCLIAFGVWRSRRLQQRMQALQQALKTSLDTEQALQVQLAIQADKLKHAAEDPITHLLGWQLFSDRLEQSIKDSSRHQLSLAVLCIDLDGFKTINEAFGAEVGNKVLYEAGQRLQSCLRQVDSISRFDKDTFVVLLTQLSKPEVAAVVVSRMLQALAEPITHDAHQLTITACIGLSFFPQDGDSRDALIRNADQALHMAKEKGKHTYQFYQERMQEKSQRELLLYSGLSSEHVFQSFSIHYQPVVNTQDASVVCMDAILGWQHQELGFVTATEIYHYADKQRKLNAISEWLLHHACKQFVRWQSAGFHPGLIGIPLTLRQLENSHFIYKLSAVMQEAGFDPKHLLVEINDSFSHVSFDILEKAFNMLTYLGVKIGINDFGSGSLSLRYLKNLTVSYIKLEHVFVDDIALNPRTVALIKSLTQLAADLSMQVIAQGVANEAQVKALQALGCTLMQGPLLAEPMAETVVIKKMVGTAVV